MEAIETEVVTINDVSFGSCLHPNVIDALKLAAEGSRGSLAQIYDESYDWLLYRGHARTSSPPGTTRYFFRADGKGTFPGSILVHPGAGVAVVSQWSGAFHNLDPLRLKMVMAPGHVPVGDERTLIVRERVGPLLKRLHLDSGSMGTSDVRIEREYPFYAVTVPVGAGDIARYSRDNAEDVGRLFTGGLEHEVPEKLRQYAESNISWRDYERLYMRWTEALALYAADGIPPRERKLALARAVQIYELCVLVRRIMVDASEEISRLSTGLTVFSPPVVGSSSRRANALLTTFTKTELQYLVSPPVQSVEGEWLLREAMRNFGILDVIESTRRNYEALDRRTQWMRGHWLAAIAVITFVANLAVTIAK